MADPQIASNLSLGQVNQPNVVAPIIYRSVSSSPPTEAIEYSLRKTTVVDSLSYPGERPKYYLRLNVGSYHRFDGGGSLLRVRVDFEQSIYLPLPQQLIDVNQVVYDAQQLGTFGGGLATAAAKTISSLKGNTGVNNQENATGSVAGGLGGAVVGGALIAGDAITRGNVSGLATAALGVVGYTPNQFLTILLKGPAYKRHSFTWLVSPRNERELENLYRIATYINNAKAPVLEAGGALFGFPKVFQASFHPNSKYLYKFKPAVVESFTIDAAAGGLPSFTRANKFDGVNGAAVYQLRLDLLEIEYWLQGNYQFNNEPEDVHRLTPGSISFDNLKKAVDFSGVGTGAVAP